MEGANQNGTELKFMSAHRILAIALRQFYLLRGSPVRILPLFGWVLVDIVLWGFITKYLNGVAGRSVNFVATLLGTVLLWDFMARVMQGFTTAFFEDVWARNFLNIFATPLKLSEYVCGLVSASITTSSVGLVAMVLLATTVFGLSFLAYGMLLVPFLLVLFVTGISLGILGSSLVLRLGPAAEWFIWPIPAMLGPFSGVYYPLSTLPVWMQFIGHLLPASYVFEGMRSVIAGHGAPWATLGWGVGLAVVYLILICWYFAHTYHRAVRTGLIARYSAETVN